MGAQGPRTTLGLVALAAVALAGCGGEEEVVDEPITLASDEAVVTVYRHPFQLVVESHDGIRLVQTEFRPLFADIYGGSYVWEATGSRETDEGGLEVDLLTNESEAARLELQWTDARCLRIAFEAPSPSMFESASTGWELEEGELIYGLTERLRDSEVMFEETNGPMVEDMFPVEEGSLDRRGEHIEMFVRPTMSLYAPFFQSSRGYGIWVENMTHGGYSIDTEEVPDALGYGFGFASTDATKSLVQHVLLGPTHADVLKQYFALTGDPIRPPDWAFLHWRWRGELPEGEFAELDGELVNADIAADVLAYEEHGIPFGVYLFDRPYLVGGGDSLSGGFSEFVWDEERVINPEHTLAALDGRGMPIAVWAASWARGEEAGTNGAAAIEHGYHAPGSDRVIDLTNPDAVAWWQETLGEFIETWGIRGIKLDRGEEFIPNDPTDIWHDGRNGFELHNEFQVIQSQVHHDALDAATGGDFVLMPRSGYSGSQQYAIHWGGDAAGTSDLGLRAAIIMLQRAGFMGFTTWGSDTGGYYEFDDREVFARWLQFSALCPIMEIGGEGTHAPWDMPTDPVHDEEMIEIYRRYVQLHHDLQPYLAEQADAVAETGMPIARAMVFDFPGDPAMLDRWDQFMLGPDVLVAPVWRTGEREREVVLPEGDWEDLWDRDVTWTGPATITVDAPLDTIPVFVRPGGLPR